VRIGYGPLNGTFWTLSEMLEFDRQEIAGWDLAVYGFVELTAEDELATALITVLRLIPDAVAAVVFRSGNDSSV